MLHKWGSFFFKALEFNLNPKNTKKMQQNVYGFLDNLIWIGNRKISLVVVGTQHVKKQS